MLFFLIIISGPVRTRLLVQEQISIQLGHGTENENLKRNLGVMQVIVRINQLNVYKQYPNYRQENTYT